MNRNPTMLQMMTMGAVFQAMAGIQNLPKFEGPKQDPGPGLHRGSKLRSYSKPVEKKFPGTGRNELCPCGSGKKYKRCHGL